MKTRQLGKSGLAVSEIGYGCMGLSHGYGTTELSHSDQIALIRSAYEQGVTLFDTAEVYGDNEALVGEALEPMRDDIALATKCGIQIRDGKQVIDGSPGAIRTAIDKSLIKLRTDRIDLYYLHPVDPCTPIEVVAETMSDLMQQGKIRHWGLSEANADTIRRAHAVCPLAALQSEYSMMNRQPEATVMPVLEELGIGFVPFSPLGRGFLTDTIKPGGQFESNDFRQLLPRFNPENICKNQVLLDLIAKFAEDKDATDAQIALSWVLAQRPWIVPIPGTRQRVHLEENLGAAMVTLSAKELSELTAVIDQIEIAGDRYPPGSDYAKRASN